MYIRHIKEKTEATQAALLMPNIVDLNSGKRYMLYRKQRGVAITPKEGFYLE